MSGDLSSAHTDVEDAHLILTMPLGELGQSQVPVSFSTSWPMLGAQALAQALAPDTTLAKRWLISSENEGRPEPKGTAASMECTVGTKSWVQSLTITKLTSFCGGEQSHAQTLQGTDSYAHLTYRIILGFPLLWWNTMNKGNLEGKGLFLSVLHNHSSSKAVKAGIHTGQDVRGRSWCRSHGGMLLTGLHLMTCSACFLMEPRITRAGVTPPSGH